MITAADLRKQIRATPDDTFLRLVYADAIQEEGDEELAQFIRRTAAGEDVRTLPGSIKADLRTVYTGPAPGYEECQRVRVGQGPPLYASVVSGCILFWEAGFVSGFRGPAVGGWERLGPWLYDAMPIRWGHITDSLSRWDDAVRKHNRPDTKLVVWEFARTTLSWDYRELMFSPRGSELLPRSPTRRRRWFEAAWPNVKWTFDMEDA